MVLKTVTFMYKGLVLIGITKQTVANDFIKTI